MIVIYALASILFVVGAIFLVVGFILGLADEKGCNLGCIGLFLMGVVIVLGYLF